MSTELFSELRRQELLRTRRTVTARSFHPPHPPRACPRPLPSSGSCARCRTSRATQAGGVVGHGVVVWERGQPPPGLFERASGDARSARRADSVLDAWVCGTRGPRAGLFLFQFQFLFLFFLHARSSSGPNLSGPAARSRGQTPPLESDTRPPLARRAEGRRLGRKRRRLAGRTRPRPRRANEPNKQTTPTSKPERANQPSRAASRSAPSRAAWARPSRGRARTRLSRWRVARRRIGCVFTLAE